MKKKLLVAFFAMLPTATLPYSIKINNRTDGQIKAKAHLATGAKEKLIEARKSSTISTGAICSKKVEVTPTSGNLQKKTYTFNPQKTGYAVACKNFEFNVLPRKDGGLALEPVPGKKSGYTATLINETNSQVLASIQVTAPGYCSTVQALLSPKETRQVKLGTCCTSQVVVRKTDANLQSDSPEIKAYTFIPRRTGVQEACRGYTMRIIEARDGSLSMHE